MDASVPRGGEREVGWASLPHAGRRVLCRGGAGLGAGAIGVGDRQGE